MIRRAILSDADALEPLWAALLESQSDLDGRFKPSDDAVVRWRNEFPDWLDRDGTRLFVAQVNGNLRGFLMAETWAPPPIYLDRTEIYVGELYVEPSFRRRGIASSLVRAAADWGAAIGAERVRAGALAANADALAFWKTVGGAALSVTFAIELALGAGEGRPKTRTKLGFT